MDYAYRLANTKIVKTHRLTIGATLTIVGLAYQVLGAWPNWDISTYPWDWQKTIASAGGFLVWFLFAVTLAMIVVGCVVLYVDSLEYHKKHPELYADKP
jgi:hypothetical protein